MVYVFLYLASIVLANFVILWFGAKWIIINSFVLIGLDLTLRDKLHERWHHQRLWLKMFLLIFSGSVITYFLNRSALQIAAASVVAFGCATLTDAIIYSFLFYHKFLIKANGSNLGGALVDSILFPTIAFGAFMPLIVLGQFLAKVMGGFFLVASAKSLQVERLSRWTPPLSARNISLQLVNYVHNLQNKQAASVTG